MGMFDALCRRYQSLFARTHPEEAELVELNTAGRTDQFLDAYFAREFHVVKQLGEDYFILERNQKPPP